MQICNDAFLCVRGGLGKGEDKLGAHAFCADHIDIFPVGLDGFLYNGKPEAGSFLISRPVPFLSFPRERSVL